jgi:tetratricopeptide (TPR) repeat protein
MKPRIPFLLLLTLLVSACQLMEPRWEPEEAAHGEAREVREAPANGVRGLSRVIGLLQDGENEPAEDMLLGLLDDDPDHRLAARLLRQLHEPPESLLGDELTQVVVEPGDTLSGLAERHAGDSMLFVALARLNAIEQPRLLRPGTVLRVPLLEEPPDENGDSAVSTAESLLAKGQPEHAYHLVMRVARAGNLDERGRSVLLRSAVAVSERHLAEGRVDQADATLDRLQPWAELLDGSGELKRQRDRINVHRLEQEGNQTAAMPALVDRYHERALTAWRAQEVDEAVACWERVLELNPDFEPAQVYLERAREVQRRLKELEVP